MRNEWGTAVAVRPDEAVQIHKARHKLAHGFGVQDHHGKSHSDVARKWLLHLIGSPTLAPNKSPASATCAPELRMGTRRLLREVHSGAAKPLALLSPFWGVERLSGTTLTTASTFGNIVIRRLGKYGVDFSALTRPPFQTEQAHELQLLGEEQPTKTLPFYPVFRLKGA